MREAFGDRMEGAVLVVRRAAALDPYVRRRGELVAERLHESRFPHTGLTAHDDRLAVTLDHLLPAVEHERDLLLAADERRPRRVLASAPCAFRAGVEHAVDGHGLGD